MVVEAPAGNRVLVRWPSPACLAPGDADATVAAFVLSGTAHSRLDRRMIHDLDIASDLAATQSGETDAGAFMITASAGDDHTNEEIMREIDAALEVIRTQPVAQAEFNGAKRRVIALARRQGLTLESRAEQLAAYAQFTARPLDLASEEIRLLEQTTPQSVLAFTQQWLTPEHRLVAMLRRAYREERRGVLVRGPARLTPRNALQASHGATNGDDK